MLYSVTLPFGEDGEKIKKISCGAVFSAALTTKGHVYAWGKNHGGQTGHRSGAKELREAEKSQDGRLNMPTESGRGELE